MTDYEKILTRAIQQHRQALMGTENSDRRRAADLDLWHTIGQVAVLRNHILETQQDAPKVKEDERRAQ